VVQEYFPGTPWVCGGYWSWYASGGPEVPGDRDEPVLFYHYLPLLVLLPDQKALAARARQVGVSVVVVSPGGELEEDQLREILDGLRDQALSPWRNRHG